MLQREDLQLQDADGVRGLNNLQPQTPIIGMGAVLNIVASIILTWVIGLAPPLVIRYAILKRPMNKWPAIGTCASFWILNVILFTALGSQSKTHAALGLVAFASYWLLRKAEKGKEVAQ
jgi:hypothetical protein